MADPAKLLAAVRKAADDVDGAEADLRAARERFWRALREANEQGVSLAAIGRELGVTRQRVGQMLRQAP